MDRIYDLPLVGLLLKFRRIKQSLAWIRARLGDSPAEIEARRTAALRSVCLQAYRRSPFYRGIWQEAGISEGDLADLRHPSVLPVVSKSRFRSALPEEMCSNSRMLRRSREIRTTGSTGSPVRIRLDRESILFSIALFSRPSMVAHLGLSLENGLHIMVQSPTAIEGQAVREVPRAAGRFVDALRPVSDLIEEINRRKPQYILSYPGIIQAVASEVRRRKRPIWTPDYFIFSGETLNATTVESIRRTFPRAQLSQAYCATESMGIAVQCSAGPGLHVLEYRAMVEVLDDDGRAAPPGQTGRIVVTDLQNRVFPVIRYAGLGDLGAWAEEICGCPLAAYPRLGRLEGRTAETIRLPDGRLVHQFVVTSVLERFERAAAFQLRQETEGEVRLLLVPEDPADRFSEKIRDEASARLQPVLPGLSIAVEFVESIPREPGFHKTPAVVGLPARSGIF